MLQTRLRIYRILAASQILLAYGFKSTGLPQDIIDADFPSQSQLRAYWSIAGVDGYALWKDWKKKTGRDIPPPAPLNQEFNFHFHRVHRTDRHEWQQLLRDQGLNERGSEVVEAVLLWPFLPASNPPEGPDDHIDCEPAYTAQFWSLVGASLGVFVDYVNERRVGQNDPVPDDPVGPPLPEEWKYSHLAWYMWKKTVQRRYPGKYPRDYSGLNLFIRKNVRDDRTRYLIGYLLASGGATRGTSWKFSPFTPRDDEVHSSNTALAFWPLLGSPLGQEVMQMLIDNKKALGGKCVKLIEVQWDAQLSADGTDACNMGFVLGHLNRTSGLCS